jgi:hypothetical protein
MEFRVGKAGLLFVFFEGAKELHLPSLRNFLFVDLPRLYSLLVAFGNSVSNLYPYFVRPRMVEDGCI